MSPSASTTTTLVFGGSNYKSNKKVYSVWIDNNLDYVIKAKTNKKNGVRVFKMYYSNSDNWLNGTRNSLTVTMYNTGNNLKFSFPNKSFNLTKVSYHEMEQINIISDVLDFEDKFKTKIKFKKEKSTKGILK